MEGQSGAPPKEAAMILGSQGGFMEEEIFEVTWKLTKILNLEKVWERQAF